MADTRVSGLTALTGAAAANGDLLLVVDVSDTAMAGTGSDKAITMSEFGVAMRTRITAAGDVTGPLSALILANSGVTAGSYGTSTVVPRIAVNAKGLITSVSNQTIAGALPPGMYDVTHLPSPLVSLVDDFDPIALTGTDNSAALLALLATVPVHAKGYTFVWPINNTGNYRFNSSVEWRERPVHNIGVGYAGSDNFPLDGTALYLTANSTSMFTVTGGTGGGTNPYQASPSFEKMWFSGDGSHNTSTVGITLTAANRCHLTDVGFASLGIGVKMNDNGQDCAWHSWRNVSMIHCFTGLLSTASNSWSWYGGYMGDCGIGIDVGEMINCHWEGLKINAPHTFGMRLGVNGAASGAGGSFIKAAVEMLATGLGIFTPGGGTLASGRTAVQVNGSLSSPTSGTGLDLRMSIQGASDGSTIGFDFTAGSHHNFYKMVFQTDLSAANAVHDTGFINTPTGMYLAAGTVQYNTTKEFNIPTTGSGFVYTNSTGRTLEVVVQGGTVSQIVMSRVAVFNLGITQGVFLLGPGDAFSINYSVAPTVTAFPII